MLDRERPDTVTVASVDHTDADCVSRAPRAGGRDLVVTVSPTASAASSSAPRPTVPWPPARPYSSPISAPLRSAQTRAPAGSAR